MEENNNQEIENELWPEDKKFIDSIKDSYYSEEEKLFFETICKKMRCEYAPCGELLISPRSNSDKISLHREEYDEFIVGHLSENESFDSVHVMKLCDALQLNLRTLGFNVRNVTLFEWLRETNYSFIIYNHNNVYQ